jgi:hypothetical protein
MKRKLQMLSLILISAFITHAQNIDLLSLGSGELPVLLKGTAKDDAGFFYHFGDFRGAFTVGSDTLLYGNGGNDLFLYKTDVNGQMVWAKNYGLGGSESATSRLFYYKDGLYGIFRISSETTISGINVSLVKNSIPTTCLIKFDTSGNAVWVMPTNASISTEIHFFNNKVRVLGSISRVSGSVYVRDSIILPSTGFNNRFFVDIDLEGNIEQVYNVFQNNNLSTSFSMQALGNFQHNQFYLLVQTSGAFIQPGNNKLKVHNTDINIPNTLNAILIKTDSNFNVYQHKILDPSGTSLFLDISQDRLSINETGDSLFLLLNVNSGNYVVDQFNVDIGRQRYVATYDTTLVTRSLVRISHTLLPGNTAETNYYRLFHHSDAKYYFGVIRGLNQVKPPSEISHQIVNINLFKNIIIPFNINGPSISFVVKEPASGDMPQFKLLGDHSTYEEDYIKMSGFALTDGELMFVNPTDDFFNPWRINNTLDILQGRMRHLTDKTETLQRIQYFEDGSKFLVGSAIGKTIFEDDDNQTYSTAKSDIFFAVLNTNNSLKQYHRVNTSFRYISILKQIKKGNKIYLLYNFSSARNQVGKNFVIINGQTILIPGDFYPSFLNGGYKLLFIIDEAGNLQYRNMYDLPIGPANAFDVYDNEDLLVVTANNSKPLIFNGDIFPGTEGFYAGRIDRNNIIKGAVKFYSTTNPKPTAENIQLMPGEHNFIISSATSFTGSVSMATIQVLFSSGSTRQIYHFNPYPGTTTPRGYLNFHKLNFSTVLNNSALGPLYFHYPQTQLVTSHGFYAGFINSAGITEPLKFNGEEVSPSSSIVRSHILKMDTTLKLIRELTFNSIGNNSSTNEFIPSRLIETNGHIYMAGRQNKELKFGAVTIPYKGEGDGLVIKMDSSFNLLKYFGLQSLNAEQITDIDIFKDSVIAFAAFSLSTPQLIVGPQNVSSSNNLKQEDLGPVHYLANVPIQDLPADLIITKQHGDWHDPATWNTGAVPGSDAKVVIKHKVQIGQAASCKTVFMDATGNIQVASGIVLTITGENNN